MTTSEILTGAKKQTAFLANLNTGIKNAALSEMADSLEAGAEKILAANALDVESSRGRLSESMIDRLTLTKERIAGMAKGIRDVITLPDPCGKILSQFTRPNGLCITKKTVPIGLIAIIYEARPNVTSDAAALCFKSGNVCVLRGGKEAYRSSRAIIDAMREGLKKCSLPETLINLVDDTTRASAQELMTATGVVDLLIPRGGAGLIKACVEGAKVPCIHTGTGICHIYVDDSADFNTALDIIENAKTSRPSVCNAAEVCLVNRNIAKEFLPLLKNRLVDSREKNKVELRLCEEAAKYTDGTPASASDFDTEFLDYILAVNIVGSVSEAVDHIAAHGTHHSECIITNTAENAELFTAAVDSAAVYVNASTRFTDGGEFGLGCEIGISTQKIHARGPMGLEELCSYKYVISGNGQIR